MTVAPSPRRVPRSSGSVPRAGRRLSPGPRAPSRGRTSWCDRQAPGDASGTRGNALTSDGGSRPVRPAGSGRRTGCCVPCRGGTGRAGARSRRSWLRRGTTARRGGRGTTRPAASNPQRCSRPARWSGRCVGPRCAAGACGPGRGRPSGRRPAVVRPRGRLPPRRRDDGPARRRSARPCRGERRRARREESWSIITTTSRSRRPRRGRRG